MIEMPQDKFFYQVQKWLSQRLAIIKEEYNETSCLSPDMREIIGYCRAYLRLFPEDQEFCQYLNEKIIPAMKEIGVARWMRSELTDLGFAIADKDEEQVEFGIPEEEEEDIRQ
jgi:hypothetical protein